MARVKKNFLTTQRRPWIYNLQYFTHKIEGIVYV